MSNRNKYRAKRTTVDGITFDSKREARRWQELKLLERAGKISDLRRQVAFPLYAAIIMSSDDSPFQEGETLSAPIMIRSAGYPNGRQAKYVADFVYVENGKRVIEDVKGGKATDTPLSRLKRAIVEAQEGVRIRLT